MEYTKRDLELVQILRDNFEKLREDHPYDLLACSRILFKSGIFSYGDDYRLRGLIQNNLPPRDEWEHHKKWYPWEVYKTEPRKQFLDDLIAKIKNSL